jgi:hypothetical protein
VNHVERQALLCGYSVERTHHDYGLDLAIDTYDDEGEIENGRVLLQLKATDQLRRVGGGQFITWRIARADLGCWLREVQPFILVVYDAVADKAYWLHVQAYFARQAGFDLKRVGSWVTIRIPSPRKCPGSPGGPRPGAAQEWNPQPSSAGERIMLNRVIPFSTLRELLTDLGFVQKNGADAYVVFEHVPSDTLFVFPKYRPREPVREYHLLEVRKHLDERGVLAREDFENWLHGASVCE